jgi:glycosyltransferase involved in cell wall biosynthesis
VDTLLRAVNSVLNQTYPIMEIIVCDDGSDDNSSELILKLNNPIVRWINCGRNGRPAIPRNIGIKESKGDWIAFLDSDDEWLPEKIEKQFEVLTAKESHAICSNAYRIVNEVNHGPYLNIFQRKIGFNSLLHTNFIICSSVLIHRSLMTKITGFSQDEKLRGIEDYDLWLKISVYTDFIYVKTPLLKYFDNPSTSIRKYSNSIIGTTKELVFSSFMIWIENLTTSPPLYNHNKLRSAVYNKNTYKLGSFFYVLLNKFYFYMRR